MESETDLQREEFFQNVDLNAFPIVLQFEFFVATKLIYVDFLKKHRKNIE